MHANKDNKIYCQQNTMNRKKDDRKRSTHYIYYIPVRRILKLNNEVLLTLACSSEMKLIVGQGRDLGSTRRPRIYSIVCFVLGPLR